MAVPKVAVCNIVTAMLKSWFPEDGYHSWENGVMLNHQSRAPVLMQMRVGPMPQDADAFKHGFSLKASSGQSPCPWRSNCMARVPYFEGESCFPHIHSPEHRKFTQHCSGTFSMVADDLERLHGPTLKEREIIYGLKASRTPL